MMLETLTKVIQAALKGDEQSLSLIAAVYMLLVCGYSVFYQVRMSRWPSVPGKLRHTKIRTFGARERVLADQDYVADALYEYEVDGTPYENSRISPWVIVASHNVRFILHRQLNRITIGPDGEIAVHYNPQRLENSVLKTPRAVGQLITMTIGIAPTALYAARYGLQI